MISPRHPFQCLALNISFVLFLCIMQCSPALCEPQPQWFFGGGARFSTSPYKAYSSWSPSPLLGYEGEYFYIRGLEAGVKLFQRPWLELSAFGGFDPTSFHARYSDNKQLKKLDDRFESALVGVAVRARFPLGQMHAKVAVDVLGNSNGVLAEAGYGYRWQWGALTLTPSTGLRWYSSQYQKYYYGVSASESARSGLRRYTAEAGLDPYAGLRLGYTIGETWNIIAGVDAAFLNSQIQNSPMTDKGIRCTTYAGIVYLF